MWNRLGTERLNGGYTVMTPTQTDLAQRAEQLLREDAKKIEHLIAVQLDNLTAPKCPLYEEVLDTQMFGLSREIDFAVRAGLITREQGRSIISELEQKLAHLYSTVLPSPNQQQG
ncbi:protein of hypothetical function DUF1507 [Desmospora sp. 8437]|nr:protein of hypothetical function DUF1507 [Desmospora sp. 8437]